MSVGVIAYLFVALIAVGITYALIKSQTENE